MDVEYLIVGAGAAGCTLGWLLRQARKSVLVLERRDARKKDKLCGGILGITSLATLTSTFGEDALKELAPTRPAHKINRCLSKESISRCAYATISRKQLDDWLLARYVATDGAIRDRTRLVSVDEERHTARCRDLRTGMEQDIAYCKLVGADGANSTVRHLLTGRTQKTVMAFEGLVDPVSEDIVFAYDPRKIGYCWYIPTGTVANVGCMSYGDDAARCRTWLATFCEDMNIQMPHLRGAPIPTGSDMALRAGADAYLVGDAAGLASPVDGGGIHYALLSAVRLAESLLEGGSYEQAMEPVVTSLAHLAAKRAETYLHINLLIAYKGDVRADPL